MKPVGPPPRDVKKSLLGKWNKGIYLRMSGDSFPLHISLGKISARLMTDRYDDLRNWVALYLKEKSLEPFLRWETVNHRLLGKNNVPRELVFPGAEDLARFLGRQNEWEMFNRALDALHRAHENLWQWGKSNPLPVLSVGGDLERLLLLWKWMVDHVRPDIYLRQIDLPGIDSKFTESHKKILSQWLDLTLPEHLIKGEYRGVSRFEERYGYRGKPELIRFRFLDEDLKWRGCDDISLPAEQFRRLYVPEEEIPVEHVFVVENDICGLTFPPVKKAVVIFGRGIILKTGRAAYGWNMSA